MKTILLILISFSAFGQRWVNYLDTTHTEDTPILLKGGVMHKLPFNYDWAFSYEDITNHYYDNCEKKFTLNEDSRQHQVFLNFQFKPSTEQQEIEVYLFNNKYPRVYMSKKGVSTIHCDVIENETWCFGNREYIYLYSVQDFIVYDSKLIIVDLGYPLEIPLQILFDNSFNMSDTSYFIEPASNIVEYELKDLTEHEVIFEEEMLHNQKRVIEVLEEINSKL